MVEGKNFKDGTIPSHMPISKSAYSKDILNKNRERTNQQTNGLKQTNHYRVKYHPSCAKNNLAIVKGTLQSGKMYPVVLDTGASAAFCVNDVHIQENKFKLYPFRNNDGHAMNWGMCDLGELRIGEMILANWPCYYQQRHTEIQLFGFPIFKDKTITVGLPILRQFKYIEFDNPGGEIYFSLGRSFGPDELSSWKNYSFVIEEDERGNTFLIVDIPIAGEMSSLQLDTGNGGGLAVSTELWGRMSKRIENIKMLEGKDLYPYIGRFSCKQGVIPKIEIGHRTVNNVRTSVFPDDSPIMEGCNGLLGMQCFRNNKMVLDFEKSMMWVKGL
ncbi:MAG: hypothetical protein PVH77_04505 [Phycisphaerales bacterium]|jgi:hypothetical protein